MVDRIVVFVDAQNAYRGARTAFFTPSEHHTAGQVDPVALGQLICDRGQADRERRLESVRIYTGRPSATRDPRSYSAHMKQCAEWERRGAVVIWRNLRYPPIHAQGRPEEKGIDVALAVDLVAGAIDDAYDIGVIMSTDTDLKPALEYVVGKFHGAKRCEVAAWKGGSRRLDIEQARLWCHFLDAADYDLVRDPTDYNA